MAIKLDKSRPYGTVHGEGAAGRCYEQDGNIFDAFGDLIVDSVDSVDSVEPVLSATEEDLEPTFTPVVKKRGRPFKQGV